MTIDLSVLAMLVAAAAAVRSTWSPCGRSMLSTITPFGERARGHRYGATASWFIAGATLGGLLLGVVIAGLGVAYRAAGMSAETTGTCALAATVVVLASDTGLAGLRLPVHRRQVNERWLDAFRPWVYGAGFGLQIGAGITTYITTGGIYLLMVLGALTGRPAVALAAGGAFGFIRGLAVLLNHRVNGPAELLAFHQRFAARLPWADRLVAVSLGASVVVLAVAVGPGPTLAVVLPVAVGVVAVRGVAWTRRQHRVASPSERSLPADSVHAV